MRAMYVGVGPGEKIYRMVVSEILKRKLTNIRDAYSLKESLAAEISEPNVNAVTAAIEFYFDECTQSAWEGRSIEEYMSKHTR